MNLQHLNEALTAFLKLAEDDQKTFLNLITQKSTKAVNTQTDAENKRLESALRKFATSSGRVVSPSFGVIAGYNLLDVQE